MNQGRTARRLLAVTAALRELAGYFRVIAFSEQISWQQKQVIQVSASTWGRERWAPYRGPAT